MNEDFVLQQGRQAWYEGEYSSHTRSKYKMKSDAVGGHKTIYEMTSSQIAQCPPATAFLAACKGQYAERFNLLFIPCTRTASSNQAK